MHSHLKIITLLQVVNNRSFPARLLNKDTSLNSHLPKSTYIFLNIFPNFKPPFCLAKELSATVRRSLDGFLSISSWMDHDLNPRTQCCPKILCRNATDMLEIRLCYRNQQTVIKKSHV
jgi:hypothetical protein